MDSSTVSFELESSGSDTPPSELPPVTSNGTKEGEKTHSPMAKSQHHSYPSTPIIVPKTLQAHAAVRSTDIESHDSHEFPSLLSTQKKTSGFSLERSLRSVAQYLTSKPEPNFQERHILLEDSPTHPAQFVIRQVMRKSNCGNNSINHLGGIVEIFSLKRLLDVCAFSVPEKDTFVFKMLPQSYHHCGAEESAAHTSYAPAGTYSSSSVSSHGDVGLQLLFRGTTAVFSAAKEYFRKIEIRFVSSTERNEWLQWFEKIFAAFLLDSIRTGCDSKYSINDMKKLVEDSNRVLQEKPPPAVIERYIDFFLSSAGREVIDKSKEMQVTDPSDVPNGGILRIELGDDQYETRRFAYKKRAKRSECGDQGGEEEYIVMYPTTVSQHVRMVPKHKVPISQLRVIVEEEHWGNTFFLEQSAGATDSERKSLFGVYPGQLTRHQSSYATIQPSSSKDFAITETIRLQTNSFPNRIKWLKWFEAVLRKPVVYLSRVREEKEGQQEPSSSPILRASSLFPE
ncbi:uncharacterized protein TM35_000241160 [Trypanosoma theileri]|uniref:PH domain-containing protein n=1 Tax=Trypanosoma theileri TaxID=67003 RepID=A0A1X0NQG3_9TRYP|nr:uncharacterized protein TM35_000241160 [Trypanosoma theileri]ORC86966.1 hypothetical protein TM35_000241160 [Trypanosoma theileri]